MIFAFSNILVVVVILKFVAGVEKGPSELLAGTEEDALNTLKSGYELKKLTFDDIEALVRRSWWRVALHVVRSSHEKKLDYTAPVRRATQKMKGDADELMKWLSKDFAIPKEVPCDMRWAQNATFVVISARFTHQWDLPGAKLSVFTTKGGQGHIDEERTSAALKEIFSSNITSTKAYAGLIGSSGYARKLYNVNVSLFDEIVVAESRWKVDFVRARGSMQMSKGAAIPELHVWLRKRWPTMRLWPRLTLSADDEPVTPWTEAEEHEMVETPDLDTSATESSLSCAGVDNFYCPVTDQCVEACAKCPSHDSHAHMQTRCLKAAWTGDASTAKFTDSDLLPGFVKGPIEWPNLVPNAHTWIVRWGSSPTEPLEGAPLSSGIWLTDEPVVGTVPEETAVLDGATHLLAFAVTTDGSSERLVASVPLVDRIQPPYVHSMAFVDNDPRRNYLKGTIKARVPSDRALIQKYVVYWGYKESQNEEDIKDLGLASTWKSGDVEIVNDFVQLPFEARIPAEGKHMPNMLILHTRHEDVDSVPFRHNFRDICAPDVTEGSIQVLPDSDPSAGFVGFEIILSNLPRGSDVDGYDIHWRDPEGKVLSKLAEIRSSSSGRISHTVPHGTKVPDGAMTVVAIAKNGHGHAPDGPFTAFDDWDQKSVSASWGKRTIILGTIDGKIRLLDLMSTTEYLIKKDFESIHIPLSSIMAISNGTRAWAGYDDGSLRHWDVENAFRLQTIDGTKKGSKRRAYNMNGLIMDKAERDEQARGRSQMKLHTGSVSVIAVDWATSLIASGSEDEWLHIWDFHYRQTLYKLQHEGSIRALTADWTSGKLLSGSGDGALRLLNLNCVAQKRKEQEKSKHKDETLAPLDAAQCAQKFQVVGDRLERRFSEDGVENDFGCEMTLAADLSTSPERAVVGQEDGTLVFWKLGTSGSRGWTVKGHSGTIHAISVDWSNSRMVSAGADGLIHLWDISVGSEAKPPIMTLNAFGGAVETMRVDWDQEQLLAWTAKDRSLRIWDLRNGHCIRRVFVSATGIPKITALGIS